jgi:hypothetical protein
MMVMLMVMMMIVMIVMMMMIFQIRLLPCGFVPTSASISGYMDSRNTRLILPFPPLPQVYHSSDETSSSGSSQESVGIDFGDSRGGASRGSRKSTGRRSAKKRRKRLV